VKSIRCLIAGIPQVLLADIVQRIVQDNENIEVIERVSDIDDVSAILSVQDVDVLITGMKSNHDPQRYRNIQNQFANLLIIELIDDGRHATIYVNDIGCCEIVQVIKIFGQFGK